MGIGGQASRRQSHNSAKFRLPATSGAVATGKGRDLDHFTTKPQLKTPSRTTKIEQKKDNLRVLMRTHAFNHADIFDYDTSSVNASPTISLLFASCVPNARVLPRNFVERRQTEFKPSGYP